MAGPVTSGPVTPDAIDDALASGEATSEHSGYQVGTHEISTAEVDRWRKLRAIPDDAREAVDY